MARLELQVTLQNSSGLVEKERMGVPCRTSQKGMRVLNLDPVYLKLYCDDGEFFANGQPTVSTEILF